jgi:DNA mismatch endonuclease (patch repair protein)
VKTHPKWAPAKLDPTSWRPVPGRARSEVIAEQDDAAGGRDRRKLELADGRTATGSIELKDLGGRRVYGYLRHSTGGHTVCTYVGEAPGSTRLDRLRCAWTLAHERGLV